MYNDYIENGKYYAYIEKGKVREVVKVDPFAIFRYEYAMLFVEVPEGVQSGWLVTDDGYEAPPVVVVVPPSITRRQAVQQLIIEGLDDDVQAVIDTISNVTQRKLLQAWYDESQVFERERPEINQMWAALGRTRAQLDDTFIAASKL